VAEVKKIRHRISRELWKALNEKRLDEVLRCRERHADEVLKNGKRAIRAARSG
jgi:hypothetical protein